jgi:hypothetical protein
MIMKIKGLGRVLLGVWLIAQGLLPFLSFRLPNQGFLLAILAVVAGILIILER